MSKFAILGAALWLTACASLPGPREVNVFPSPVAYVTAAPLPELTATPTTAPLPTSTPLPPTAVPKRLPQESTAAIGLWSDALTSTQSFPGFLDLAVGNAARDYQRERNQLLVTLVSRRVSAASSDRLADLQANKPDWLLYDRNKRVVFSSTDKDAPLLDIRNEVVKDQIAEDVARAINEGGFEGVLIDDVGVDLIRPTAAPVYTGTQAFSEQQRRAAVEGLLRTIRARIPDKLIIIGGYAWKDGRAFAARSDEAQTLATLADGIHIAEFLRSPISKTTEFKPEADWKRDIDYLSVASQDNKVVLLTTRLIGAPEELVRQWLSYATASYLLGKNGAHTYFQFDAGDPAYSNDPVLSAPIGAPVEAYTKLGSGIYQRKFSRGLVLVNPTNEQKKTTLDGAYQSLQGNPVDASITMGPRTGIILLRR
ncbi:MAG: putative glycoside hydrolase family 15 protein [Thermoflexales bacterium]|nr:putative glycoside hydrolase family 15 protein [Thermoflexales bacterium]MDW8352102.1 putative glycoside hydrolase [Anaerolineae bacterium]